jgi:ABC-type bacteriocin/lantibiotic exporter with double-glycine peptidase domain
MSRVKPSGARRRTPTILQLEPAEAGAAALAMVLAFHGRFVPLEELRLASGVARDGVSASKLTAVARSYGLEAQTLDCDADALATRPLPLIVFLKGGHCVVLEGVAGDRVFLNDPAVGPRNLGRAEFAAAFAGQALACAPGPDFRRGGDSGGPLQGVRRRLSGAGTAILYVVLANLALVVPALVIPSFTRIFVDEYLVRGTQDVLDPLLAGMALTALVYGLLTWLQQYYLLRLETRLTLPSSSASSGMYCACPPPTSPSARPARSARASPSTTGSPRCCRTG